MNLNTIYAHFQLVLKKASHINQVHLVTKKALPTQETFNLVFAIHPPRCGPQACTNAYPRPSVPSAAHRPRQTPGST